MTDELKQHDQLPAADPRAVIDHLCPPADVKTMARRLNLDPRRVQQLAKTWADAKNERGEYNCPRMVARYAQMQQAPKRSSLSSGLTKKQEESLEIRNARDRAEVLAEWEVMVQQHAVVKELAEIIVALKNGLREIPSVQARQVVLFAKEYAESVKSEAPISEHELFVRARKMLSEPQDEKLASFEKDAKAWMENTKDGSRGGVACIPAEHS